MKKTLLQKWCTMTWLYVVYLLGILMGMCLLIKWTVWSTPQILMCLLAIAIPLHIFEENTAPGGFFFMNNLGSKSDNPRAYPQSILTNMITNLGAEIYVIILFFITSKIAAPCMILVFAFGILETINHTRDGILMYKRYKDKGKTTIYGPGTITSYICLLPMSVYSCRWLYENPFGRPDVLLGICLILFIVVFLILIPLGISGKVKSTKYAFTKIGYFDKYENA